MVMHTINTRLMKDFLSRGQPVPYRLSLFRGRQSGNAIAEENMVDTHYGGFTISRSHESYDIPIKWE